MANGQYHIIETEWLFTVNCHWPKNVEISIYSQLLLANERRNGYIQSTVNSEKKRKKRLFTVNCH